MSAAISYAAVMRLPLRIHPSDFCEAVSSIEVEVERGPRGVLTLRYQAEGEIGALVLPPLAEPVRADGLWQRSCFEAFVLAEPGPAYCEFNFSPSTEWAAYRFSGYREDMRELHEVDGPRIGAQASHKSYEMEVTLRLAIVFPAAAAWRLGLSAVIEETNGRKSYWALAHPPGKADFHHPDSFACELS